MSSENSLRKEEIAAPFPTVFSPHLEKFLPFSSNSKCCLQLLLLCKSLKIVIRETLYHTITSFNDPKEEAL